MKPPRKRQRTTMASKKKRSSRFPGMLEAAHGYQQSASSLPSAHTGRGVATLERLYQSKQLLGPFIAILTSDGGKPFQGNQANFADLIRTGRKMGLTVYVLTPSGLAARTETTVVGYLLDPNSTGLNWIRAKLPIPNVVYNRVPNRRLEQSEEVQQAIHTLTNMSGVHLFNPYFFDKWTLYQQLAASETLKNLVPHTLKWDEDIPLSDLLKQYPVLYLKRVNGKAGIGMMRIANKKKGAELIYQDNKEKKKATFTDLRQLSKTVHQMTQQHPYLIQQGIPLATYKGLPFDIRMLLQKNNQGQWGLTGAGIRVAGPNSISTHVPMGGRIENLHRVINEVFEKKTPDLLDKIKQTGLQLAQFIESKQSSPLGEMSIDLGIEGNGTLWFFEANAKPMKFDEPDIRRLSLTRLIEYSLYLSGYQLPQKEEKACTSKT
ncbi:YheC/YheD family protein [Laceyella putida]|uniref:YheC/YheD family protein n=1 Tax=Laceyella putida TaxID=110101 RepID=A0ABW2RPH6_9BACL